MKKAVITGISGQDAAYLAQILLEKGYQVYGINRRKGTGDNLWRLDYLQAKSEDIDLWDNLHVIYGDILDGPWLCKFMDQLQPDHFYHLAAQSFVKESFNTVVETVNINTIGTLNCLEAVRRYSPQTRFYFAGSSQMFGKVREVPQKESTPFYPRSPYGVSKVAGYWHTINHKESFDLFGSVGILFNHESPLRGLEFVTRKITYNAARLISGVNLDQPLELGNMNAKRDWGHSQDYCRAMNMMLERDQPDNFVIGMGQTRSVRDFVIASFSAFDIELAWEGQGVHEKAYDANTGNLMVRVNPQFFREAQVDLLYSDPTRARWELGWTPRYDFDALVAEMTTSDLELWS